MPNKNMTTLREKQFLASLDYFTQMVYILGIKFGCDHWGICRNDVYELTSHINPDIQLDNEKVEKAISDLEQVGLIKFIGRNNALIVVVDFVRENVFSKLKGNKTMHNCESKYVADIKFAIKSGELEPAYLELPSIPEYLKKRFIEHYEGGTLKQLKTQGGTNYQDSLMYMDIYFWYQESKKGELNDKPF